MTLKRQLEFFRQKKLEGILQWRAIIAISICIFNMYAKESSWAVKHSDLSR